ncbi:AraC family ligand binding domain-containing protein [Polaromonas sp.]|uniref:AraC family transcriptional regulator n=1 Tax=Polaromonas sp. TaxID=1869339 RepID=UPI0035695C4F
MPRPTARTSTPLRSVDGVDAFTPSPARPVRVRSRSMAADTHFQPHRHPWAQLAYCTSGIVQVTAATPDEVTYIVPPSRAVWIAPGALHAINVLEAAEFRTLYIHAQATSARWLGCSVIVVSPLMREMVHFLDMHGGSGLSPTREAMLSGLLIDEIAGADTQPLGVPMPHANNGDKRLRALCEAVLRAPSERATLAEWAEDTGASERTMARLFRDELGTSYQQWRQRLRQRQRFLGDVQGCDGAVTELFSEQIGL